MSWSAEWLCRRIVEGAGDAVMFCDLEGTIRFWNEGAARIFGHTSAEAVGQSMDIIIPERLRGRHWEGWRKVMATGVTRYGTELLAVPSVKKDGSSLSIEFTIQLVRGEDGSIVGASAIVRDVTAHFLADRELRKKVKELEAKAAARG